MSSRTVDKLTGYGMRVCGEGEMSDVMRLGSGTEVADYLDDLAAELGRTLRVYVIGHKERSREETSRLIQSSDVCVDKEAWTLLDDPSRYEWVNP